MNDGAPSVPLETARRVATLARLALSDAVLGEHARALSSVLGHFESIRALDLTGVEPMAHPADAGGALGEDEPGPVLAREVLMGLAPDAAPPFLRVPRVLGESGSA